jgi:hypothetical protein
VTPYKVKKMLERMEHTPFDEIDGDYHDYLFWATDPRAYQHDLRLRKGWPWPWPAGVQQLAGDSGHFG